jgi:hypothetical protein
MPAGAAYASPGLTSYDLTAGVKVNIDELIYLLSPTDLPMTLGVDADGTMVVKTAPVDQKAFSWQDEDLLIPRTTIAATATTGDTVLTIATGERARFATGDIVRIIKAGAAAELLYITGYGSTAETLTVTRGFQSTTATNYATSAIILGVGAALAEGSDPSATRARDRTLRTNYTEIFGPYKVAMSRTDRKVSRYGVPDEWAHQVAARTRECMIHIEQALLYGVSFDDTTNKKRGTGGLTHYLTGSSLNSTVTQLTVTNIASAQQAAYNAGDVPLVLIANPNSLGDLNDTTNTSVVRQTEVDSRRGRARVEVIDTEFGTTTILRNRWCHPHTAFLVKPDGIIRRIFDPLMYEPLAKTGDADNAQIVCEEGFEIKGYQHMYAFNNLTAYTAA